MITRLSFRYLVVLLFLIDFVRCGCKNNNPSEDNNSSSNSDSTTISSSSPLPTPPPPTPITQDMIDAIKIAPGLQELLQQLQAGVNVDVNQPINSKRTSTVVFPDKDLPLNLVFTAIIQHGNAIYTQDRLNVIESLLSRRANPNPTITLGIFPKPLLFSVILNKKLDILKLLLKYKDATFTQPHDGYTPYAYVQGVGTLTPAEQPPFIQAFEDAGINS